MTVAKSKMKQKVAIVGSGMAGLATAYLLHNDVHKRYNVTVFESGDSFSLDSASVSIRDESKELVERIDVPMRAFAEGYYKNLIRMYKYLQIRYSSQRFLYSFENTTGNQTQGKTSDKCYFTYSSNLHQFPPIRPQSMSLLSWLMETIYVAVFYFWWSMCCFWIPPLDATDSGICETLDQYVRRIMLPSYFVNFYLLPLLASVATCSHKALLQFPARDLTEYKRQSAGGDHYTVSGIHEVQRVLGSGLEATFSALVTKVEVLNDGKLKVVWDTTDMSANEELFDQVVMAVAPDIAGRIFLPLRKATSQIPTTLVQSVVNGGARMSAMKDGPATSVASRGALEAAQTIRFRTSQSLGQTEAIHIHGSGAMVTTSPLDDISTVPGVLKSVQFYRGLRTPRSRHVVKYIFGESSTNPLVDEKQSSWRNGDDKVWLVGGWCWDGMVLLEGCVVSAMRVASALDVDIPWRSS